MGYTYQLLGDRPTIREPLRTLVFLRYPIENIADRTQLSGRIAPGNTALYTVDVSRLPAGSYQLLLGRNGPTTDLLFVKQ